jgi:nucleotide-binding universal stress UspA family protein
MSARSKIPSGFACIIHDGSLRKRVKARRGASGTRREKRYSFRSPLASRLAPLTQTIGGLQQKLHKLCELSGIGLQRHPRSHLHGKRVGIFQDCQPPGPDHSWYKEAHVLTLEGGAQRIRGNADDTPWVLPSGTAPVILHQGEETMRIVVGVDWSDEAFNAVEQIGLLYRSDDVVLVHGVDLGMLQSPIVAGAVNLQGYDEFRQALIDAGRQAVERCRTLLPAETPSIRTMCEVQHPAAFILDSAAVVKADLIAMGTHEHSRMKEVFVGSVSHRVLLHTTVPTLIVKGKARPVTRVLMAVEGHEDAIRLHTWLTSHPFKNPVEVTILSVIPSLPMVDTHVMVGLDGWAEQSTRYAEQVVNDTAQALTSPHFRVSTDVRLGDPFTTVCEVGHSHDLIVVGSHGRKGFDRFLLGSVSHGIVYRAGCSVLVVR